MRSRETMTPREVCAELQICNKTLGRWGELGKVRVAFFTLGGHARYNRATIDAFKLERAGGVAEPQLNGPAELEPVTEPDPPAPRPKPLGLVISTSHEPRRSAGETLLSKIEAAKRPAERGARAQQHLTELHDAAIQELLGLSRGELFSHV
jgi:hypothetical protein